MNTLVYVVLNALFFSVVYGSNEKYRGNQLLELKPSTQKKSMKLLKFMDTHKASTVEVWSRNGSNCQIQMTAQGAQLLKSFCQLENINYKVVIADVKRAIDTEIQHNEATISFGFNYEKFNRYDPIVQELFRLQTQFAHLMKVSMVGRSYEDRPLFLVRISECMSGCHRRFADDKPIIWIDGGIHAREWISVAAALYMMKQVQINNNKKCLCHSSICILCFFLLPAAFCNKYFFKQKDKYIRYTATKTTHN
ncbi:carboxypeptidase A2-like [Hydractinia symbiolongicarpus]|uniref:carboxypeptidase A2-like n=1 Tax=Hydractinia symbiolongicarpus TaxID=13093 RepID=UPI0025518D62|nr:carboxypeptidase A2-like [Hydractinia symbiolongicarpus]